MTEKKPTYNGWSNYETWLVNLWLTNDAETAARWTHRGRAIMAEWSGGGDDRDPIVALAEELCDEVHELCTIDAGGLAADLMTAVLSEVGWYEVASSFVFDWPPPSRANVVSLGFVTATPGALSELTDGDRTAALARHVVGDWGDVDREDWEENDLSLREGFRLLSAYHSATGTKFWIITEADRSVTTILLPSEY